MDEQKSSGTVPPPPKPSSLPSPPMPPLHQDDVDEEDENVKQLKECSVLYLSLQECLVQNDRNWKSCQLEVKALKECHERKRNNIEK